VLRLPGFYNKKYEAPYRIEARQESSQVYRLADFKVSLEAGQAQERSAFERPASRGSSLKTLILNVTGDGRRASSDGESPFTTSFTNWSSRDKISRIPAITPG